MNPHVLVQDSKQLESLATLKRVDEKGYLYHMVCNYDYTAIPEPLLAMLNAGCSSFYTKNLSDEYLFCRNYDFSHFLHNDRHNPRTGVNVVLECKSPNAKYASIGVCDAFWLDYQNGSYQNGCLDDGTTDISALLLSPYVCMDGINEKGVGVSVMALGVDADWEEIPYESAEERAIYGMDKYILKETGALPDKGYIYAKEGQIALNLADHKAWVAHMSFFETTMPNKQATVIPPVMMRMILDNCANVEEGIALAENLNIKAATVGSAYHIMIVDAYGNSVLLEWNHNRMSIIDTTHVTNYRVVGLDAFDGVCRRDECLKAGLNRFKNGMREDYALHLMALVAQDATNKADRNQTQYSCMYNVTKKTLDVYSFLDFSKGYHFAL